MWKEIFLDQGSNGMTLAGRLLDITQKDLRDDAVLNIVCSIYLQSSNQQPVRAVLSNPFPVRTQPGNDSVCTTLG